MTGSSGRGRKSQCASLVWRGHLNLLDYSVGRRRARLHDDAKMWQWGNSVTAYCVMSPWFLTYCEGDEREKMASNGFSVWWKGAPADGASVSFFLKTGWQRMRRGKKEKWMSTERNIGAHCSAEATQYGGGMLRIQLHACNKILISHLYSHPERAGVDYTYHTTN